VIGSGSLAIEKQAEIGQLAIVDPVIKSKY